MPKASGAGLQNAPQRHGNNGQAPATRASSAGEVYIVDDDPSLREALAIAFSLAGYRTTTFADGCSFLAAMRTHAPTCILLDIRMPDRSGLEILKELNAERYNVPVFIISAHGDVAMAIDAIKSGALDFMEKPLNPDTVTDRVRAALDAAKSDASERGRRLLSRQFAGRDLLTEREIDVLAQLALGSTNKAAARNLGISPRTVDAHRGRIMEKLGVNKITALIRLVLTKAAE